MDFLHDIYNLISFLDVLLHRQVVQAQTTDRPTQHPSSWKDPCHGPQDADEAHKVHQLVPHSKTMVGKE
eukprot:366000-Chlamydomonas_euryale.AAC.35